MPMTSRAPRSVTASLAICLLIGAFTVGILVRLIGVYAPAPSSADEQLHLGELQHTLDHIRAGGSQLAVHADTLRQFFAQKTLEVPLAKLFDSPSRAAFGGAALAGLISIVASAWTAGRLFGPTATWASLVLTSLSVIHANYSVKVLGLIYAYAAVAVALLCFTSRWRSLWGVGAFLLSAGFVLHYNVGVVALALAAAMLICDYRDQDSFVGWLTHVTRRRLWVGLISGGALAGYALLQWQFGDFNYASRVIYHENLGQGALYSNFRWVGILLRLDPIVSLCALSAALVVWKNGGVSHIRRVYRRHASDSFITPAVIGVTAVLVALIFTFARSLSGMTRQLFLPMSVWIVALAGCAGVAWQLLGDLSRHLALALIFLAGAATLALASADWLATRGLSEAAFDLKASLAQSRGPAVIDSATYFDFLDFLGDTRGRALRGYELIARYGRRPDVIIGRARFFPFPSFDEEPMKLYDIERRLIEARMLSLVKARDLVYSEVIFLSQPLGLQQCRAFLRSLPLRLRIHADCAGQ
jgi:hypothetical protein